MQNPNKNAGYTLIEVLIAIAIFAIGILSVASLQTDAVMKTVASRNTTEALELAGAHVEFLHGIPFYDDTLDLDGVNGVEQFDIAPWLEEGIHRLEDGEYWLENGNFPEAVITSNRYTIQWTVTDDEPLDAIPNNFSESGLPNPLTISKTIVVSVFETQRPNRPLAILEMIKIWDRDG